MREINRIIFHHSAAPDLGDGLTWDRIRTFHQAERGWSKIGYHYGIVKLAPNTVEVVSGRPVSEVGAHCKGHNGDSIGICVTGDYSFYADLVPTEKARAAADLIADLLKVHGLDDRPVEEVVIPHNRLAATECPGGNFNTGQLYRMIKERLREGS